MSYRVLVDDNYHYMDESQRWTQGEYATYTEALAACKRLVDLCLEEGYAPGKTPEALYGYYTFLKYAKLWELRQRNKNQT